MKNPRRTLTTTIVAAVCLLMLVGIFGLFALPTFAPTLDALVLGAQTGSEAPQSSDTFVIPTLAKIDDKNISAKSYLVYDVSSGETLALRAPNTPVAIASLTKLMTGYLVNKYGNMADTITVPSAGVVTVSPRLGLASGESVKVGDLFNAMIVGSANDAAATLGNYVASKRKASITDVMNSEAGTLEMINTHYSTPIGFDSDTNYSTAHDLKLLVQATQQYPTFKALDRLKSYSFSNEAGRSYSVKATNTLLGDPEIHAIKTGHTDEAQGAMITQVEHNGKTFVIIVLASNNREQDTLSLKKEIIQAYFEQP